MVYIHMCFFSVIIPFNLLYKINQNFLLLVFGFEIKIELNLTKNTPQIFIMKTKLKTKHIIAPLRQGVVTTPRPPTISFAQVSHEKVDYQPKHKPRYNFVLANF